MIFNIFYADKLYATGLDKLDDLPDGCWIECESTDTWLHYRNPGYYATKPEEVPQKIKLLSLLLK